MTNIHHIKDLTPDPRNARAHTPRNVGMIETALGEVGAARSIVIDEDGVVLAGNATIEAAAAAGIERVQVVDADGETIIAVRRSGLTPEQKTRLALFDNRAAELADWDAGVLAELAQETDLSQLFRDDELAALLADASPIDIGGAGDEFDGTPADGPTRTQSGDLWQIGPHRLLVGDCTDAANVERLMGGERAAMGFTDPPYNVEYVGKTDEALTIQNDDTAVVALAGVRSLMGVLGDGCPLYVCFPAEQPATVAAMWEAPLYLQSMIVWAKDAMVMGRKDYHYQHEPLWYGWKSGAAHRWYGGRNQVTLWEVDRPQRSADHPTEKPIALPQRAIENSSRRGDVVVDFFMGTGTTLAAGHAVGRRVFGCELSPRYADVILRRAEAAGLTCARVEP